MPGGNKKNAQRTKGNAKPSSSSQAAQLLTASGVGGLASGFIGFGSAPGAAAFVPVSQVLEEEDSGLDAAFRLTLRKLSKRDTVTKLKALQEFSDLCRDSEEDAIKATLPFWPKIYNKLSMDIDHKVRGATQAAMAVLVTRVGRNIAPHLKHVMGCWLLGLCDTYPTVATEAKLAFETAFPSGKQTDAIVFCKDVVAEFLTDNLTQQTASTLSDPKTCEADEMEMKYNRVVTSSLLAWRLLLDKLPPDSQGTVPDTLNKLLSNHKLWKFAKSTVLSIRAAVYSFLAGVCQHQSDLALTYSNKISPLVLHNIDESENTHCCSVLWEAVLAVVTYLPDCWSHINAQKAFLPKLRKLLQNGCYGNAATVGFNLLPLLSKIPDDICGSHQKLLEDIFQNLKQGLCQESIRSSPKDMLSLVSAYMECAQYTIKQSLSEPEGGEITHFLLIDQVFPLLEASFVDEDTSLFKSPLYTCTGSLLRSLGQSDHSTHDHVTLFRQEITRLMLDNVEKLTETDKGGSTLERMSVFLWAMIDPIESNASEIKKSVKFSESADGQDLCGSAKSGASLPVMKQVKVEKSVKSMVTEVCMAAVKNAVLKHCTLSLALLKSVTTILTDPEVLEPFLKYFKLSQGESDYDKDFSAETKQQTASMFVHLFTIPWIETINDKHERSAEQRIGHLLDMTFAQFGALMQTDVVILLSKLLKTLTSPSQFRLLVERCLIWRSRDQILTGWFRGAEMGERLVTLTLTVCETSLGGGGADPVDISLQWGLIASVLGTAQEEEPLLEGTVIERILGVIHQSLSSLEHVRSNNRLETAIHFITDVMLKFFCSIKGCLLVPSAESLLLTLFSLSLEEQLNISEDCSQLLEEAWCRGVTALVQQRGGLMSDSAFLKMGAHATSVRLSHVTSRSSSEKLQKTVQVLLTTVRENLPDNDLQNPTLQSLITMMSTVTSEIIVSKELLQFISVRDELLSSEDTEKPSNLVDSPVTLPTVVYPSLFSARLLYFSKTGVFRRPVPNVVGRSSSSELTKESADIPISDWNDESISHVLQLLYSLDLCEAYGSLNQMKKAAYTEELNELEYTAQSVVTSLGINARKSLVLLALEKSETEGWIWAKTLGRLLSMVLNMDSETEFSPPDFIDRYSSLTLGKVHTLQVSGAFMTVSDRLQLTELMVARVISSDIQQLTDIDGVLGSLAVMTSLFPHLGKDEETVSDLLTGVVTQLMAWRQEASIAMPDDLAGEKSSSVLTFNLTVMRFLTHLVDTAPEVLTDTSWDYVLCALIGWLQNLEENRELLMSGDFRAQELCISSSRLLASVAECIQSNVGRQTSKLPANLATEWEEFFSEGSFSNLLPLFLKLTGSRVYRELGGVQGEVVSCVSHAVSYCPQKQAVSHQLPPYLIPSQDSHIEDSIQTLLNHCCPMLLLRCRSEQIAAYWLLNRVIGEIPAKDKDDDTALAVTQAEATRSPPMSLIKVLITAGSAMEVILYGLTVEDYLKAPPHTEEFHYTLGYLLSWKLLLNFFSHVPNEVRPQYAAYLKERGIVFSLLSDLFRLMPDNPSLPAQGSGLGTNMFEVQPKLSATDCDSSRELPHLACCVYRGVLETVPAMARQWWRDQDRKTAAYIDKFSTRYVSPLLCNAEIQSVQGTEVKMDNIVVKARAASREVIATYTLEEVKTEMVISLPPNYPLGNISVTPGKRVGVTAAQWDKWLLQLNIFLQHQNGNIVDGLKMWKRNIDKRFEGVEECTICYSVIHGTTLQLPRLQCRTCKNKFHSACLYKWFSTSHNSTCPLCRNLF